MTFNVFRKPFIEFFVIIEESWHDKMKQSPQLKHKKSNSILLVHLLFIEFY